MARHPKARSRRPRGRPRSDDRRSELVGIAYRLIAEKGLEGLRTREIAAAAGIDTGTLHYHFPSKESLIRAVVDQLAASFQINRARSGREPAGAHEEVTNEILDAALRARESPDQIRVMFDLRVRGARDRAVAAILGKLDQGWDAHLVSLMNRCAELGILRPDVRPATAALMLKTALAGLGFIGLTEPERIDEAAAAWCRHLEGWLFEPAVE